jgi:hypothetical protein
MSRTDERSAYRRVVVTGLGIVSSIGIGLELKKSRPLIPPLTHAKSRRKSPSLIQPILCRIKRPDELIDLHNWR